MMLDPELLGRLNRRVAALAISASTLRNQGSSGVVEAARKFLSELDPRDFVVSRERRFMARLDEATAALQAQFPRGARNWGGARKSINIFLRDVLYCSYLSTAYRMDDIRLWLELPLDKYVAEGLREANPMLPRWAGVKHLTPKANTVFQTSAIAIAMKRGVARVDLDVLYWRADKLTGDDVRISNASRP